jgi:hypothetical protein
MLPTPPEPERPPASHRRIGPWVVAVMAVVLLAAGVAAVALRGDGDEDGGELGAGRPNATASTTVTTAGDAPGTTAAPPTTAGSPIPPAQKRVFDELMAQVADVRGLQWRGPLNLRVVSKAELARRVKEVTARDTDPAQVEAEEATLKVLGLIPADLDYEQLVNDLLAEQVLGFYDPETKELFVGGEAGQTELEPSTKYVIAHEMVHALTDQVFNFGPTTIALDKADKAEEAAALSALLEGDARLAQDLWAEKYLSPIDQLAALFGAGSSDASVFLEAPAYIQQALFFPYEDGHEFVSGLYEAGGFAAVDAAYRNPPKSTEHILHPETYRAGQAASPPALPDLGAATGCRALRTGILGEFDMRAILDEHLPNTDASRAAAGWNGDTFGLVRCGSSLGLADRWTTDPGTEPSRLVDALRQWAGQWSGSGRAPGADGRFSGPQGSGRVVRNGNVVDLVVAQDADTADRLIRALGSA